MNSASRISAVIAWLTVTLTVEPSHADGTLSTFSATISPLLANVIDQLPIQSVNEITPHVEALASIVEGNAMYDFFHKVAEECHKYQNKFAKTDERPATALEQNGQNGQNGRGKTAQDKRKESVENDASVSNKEAANEEIKDVSNAKKEAAAAAASSEKREDSKKEEAAAAAAAAASEDQNSNSEGGSSDDDLASDTAANKAPNAKKRLRLKDLPEGVTKRFRKNNTEVALLKRGDKVMAATRKPGEQPQQRESVDISADNGEQWVRKLVDKLTA